MSHEQAQMVDETTRRVHHALANIIISTNLVVEEFARLLPGTKANLEQGWKAVYLQAIQDLQATLVHRWRSYAGLAVGQRLQRDKPRKT